MAHSPRGVSWRPASIQGTSLGIVAILAVVIGTDDLGGLRGAQSLLTPLTVLAPVATLAALPVVVARRRRSREAAQREAARVGALLGCAAAFYGLGAYLFADRLLGLLGLEFLKYREIVLVVAIAQVFAGMAVGPVLLAKAYLSGRAVFVTQVTGTVLTFVALAALRPSNVSTVAWIMVMASVAALIVGIWSTRRLGRSTPGHQQVMVALVIPSHSGSQPGVVGHHWAELISAIEIRAGSSVALIQPQIVQLPHRPRWLPSTAVLPPSPRRLARSSANTFLTLEYGLHSAVVAAYARAVGQRCFVSREHHRPAGLVLATRQRIVRRFVLRLADGVIANTVEARDEVRELVGSRVRVELIPFICPSEAFASVRRAVLLATYRRPRLPGPICRPTHPWEGSGRPDRRIRSADGERQSHSTLDRWLRNVGSRPSTAGSALWEQRPDRLRPGRFQMRRSDISIVRPIVL